MSLNSENRTPLDTESVPPVDSGWSSEEESGVAEWFALVVKPRHEKMVCRALENKGYEVFLPLYMRRHKYDGRSKEFHLPLFPGYVFCHFNSVVRLPVLTTPGVSYVVGNGRTPLPVEEAEIISLRTALQVQVWMEPHAFLQVGQKVRITEGALAGLEGVLLDFKESLRLVLSITLLRRSVLLEIDRDWVTACSPVPSESLSTEPHYLRRSAA